ncbi:hypothetical protein [Mycolicibacterium sp.]|uniref:hypothetical protein n=1 Tax=Mycolicibacterium sp. TaxID=2320850 RepID=UPI003D0FF9B0
MFALGGALCAPTQRRNACPEFVGLATYDSIDIDRALIVGGSTDYLVDKFRQSDVDVTIVERSDIATEAEALWGNRAEVYGVDDIDFADDFPAKWYDVLALPGGVLQTGGMLTGSAHGWSDKQPIWIKSLRSLLSDRGRFLYDDVPQPRNLLRVVSCVRDEDGLWVSQASVVGDTDVLTFRVGRYDAVGVFAAESVSTHSWISLSEDILQLLRPPNEG